MPVIELDSKSNDVCEAEASIGGARLLTAEPTQLFSDRYEPSARSTVIRASAWSMAGYGFSQCLRLGNNLVLSYLLVPEAFGIMAIINMVIVGLSMFSDVGSGPCIVQNARGDHYQFLNTAWLVGAFRGLLITLVACSVSFPIASFYELPSLVWLIPLSSLTALISGFASTSIYTLQRHLDLKSLAVLDVQSQIVGSIVMCALALYEPTVMSLVLGTLATSFARTVLSHRMINGYHNRVEFNQADAKELFRFGKWIFLSTLLMFAALQVDRMMMGKLFDIGTLGVYGFGLAIAMLPRLMVEKLAGTILYPVLSKAARESTESFQSQLRPARGTIVSIGAAMVISVFVCCREFFNRLYHHDFHDAGEICQWLCLVSWMGMLTMTLSQALVALGRTREMAKSNAVKLPATVIASLIGFHYGQLDGFIIGLVIGAVAGHLVLMASLARIGVLLIWQDVSNSVFLVAAMCLTLVVQRSNWLGWAGAVAFAFLTMAVFWIIATVQVMRYRRSERQADAANESTLLAEPS